MEASGFTETLTATEEGAQFHKPQDTKLNLHRQSFTCLQRFPQ